MFAQLDNGRKQLFKLNAESAKAFAACRYKPGTLLDIFAAQKTAFSIPKIETIRPSAREKFRLAARDVELLPNDLIVLYGEILLPHPRADGSLVRVCAANRGFLRPAELPHHFWLHNMFERKPDEFLELRRP